jgi:hypothetical protein
MGFGVCVVFCEHGALSLIGEPSRPEPLEVYQLTPLADRCPDAQFSP